CQCSFSINTVVLIAEQLISSLQYIHARNIVHQDVKPANILICIGKNTHLVYLVDFSLAKQYRDPRTHAHIAFHRHSPFIGTPAFTSVNSHLGANLGQWDDLESLTYLLIYLLHGSLPWLDSGTRHADTILEMKNNLLGSDRLPDALKEMLKYSQTLAFDSKPDYEYLRVLAGGLHGQSSAPRATLPDWLLNTQFGDQMPASTHPLDKAGTASRTVERRSQR
ncbi:kinase-like protein, partial [Rhizopogon salebrosus TDB-379]